MRKWIRGAIAVLIFFLSIALLTSENLTLGALGLFAMFFSTLYALGLVFLFMFQQIHGWMKERSRLKAEGEIVKTKISTTFECGNCRRQYSNSETCPHCESPYRRVIKETIEGETEKRTRVRMVR